MSDLRHLGFFLRFAFLSAFLLTPYGNTARRQDEGNAEARADSFLATSPSASVFRGAYQFIPNESTIAANGDREPSDWPAISGGLHLDAKTGKPYGRTEQSRVFRNATAGAELDRFGGMLSAPSPKGATGYFRVERAGDRWLLVSPEGHFMWLFAVYALDRGDGGAKYETTVRAKYASSSVWAQQTVTRIKSWGFNAIGPYAALGGRNVLPVATYDPTNANPAKLPFIRHIDLSGWCQRSETFKTKNLYNGLNPAVVRIGRMFPDVFDPNWVKCANAFAATSNNIFNPPLSKTEPWMIGTWIGDTDYLYGFNRGPSTPASSAAPHLGWIAAVTNPEQPSGPGGGFPGMSYSDRTVHTKRAWQAYVEQKYKTITALNTAWHSTYTTFDSAGGWPKSTTGGTGVMDEDGSSSWMGKGNPLAASTSPNVKDDLDAFLYQIAQQYYKTSATACRTAYPNHLVFGTGALNAQTYPQILRAARQSLDVLEIWVEPKYISGLANAYDITGKPVIVLTTLTSQEDSEANAGKPWGSGPCTEDYDFCTQEKRGQGYAALLEKYWNAKAADGTYPVLGLDWWEWADKVTGGENMNFGLVDQWDNAYDGQEDRVVGGIDAWGHPTGNSPRNHGDFLSSVKQTNLKIKQSIATLHQQSSEKQH